MKIWLTVMMAALQAAGMVTTSTRSTKQRVSYVPTQAPSPTSHKEPPKSAFKQRMEELFPGGLPEPALAQVIDFATARQRILEKRLRVLGVSLE